MHCLFHSIWELQGLLLPKGTPPDWMAKKHLHGSKAHRPRTVPRLRAPCCFARQGTKEDEILIRGEQIWISQNLPWKKKKRTYPGPGHQWHQILGSSGILAGFFFLCSDEKTKKSLKLYSFPAWGSECYLLVKKFHITAGVWLQTAQAGSIFPSIGLSVSHISFPNTVLLKS